MQELELTELGPALAAWDRTAGIMSVKSDIWILVWVYEADLYAIDRLEWEDGMQMGMKSLDGVQHLHDTLRLYTYSSSEKLDGLVSLGFSWITRKSNCIIQSTFLDSHKWE